MDSKRSERLQDNVFQIKKKYLSEQYFKKKYELTDLQFEVLWYRYLINRSSRYIMTYKSNLYIGERIPEKYVVKKKKDNLLLVEKNDDSDSKELEEIPPKKEVGVEMFAIDKKNKFIRELNGLKQYCDPIVFLRKNRNAFDTFMCQKLLINSQLLDQLIIKDKDKETKRTCIICFEGKIEQYALVPCGHTYFCMTCIDKLMRTTKTCSVCRKQITSTLRIYL